MMSVWTYSRPPSLTHDGAVIIRLFFVCISDDIRLASVAWHGRNEDIFRSEKYSVRIQFIGVGQAST